MADVGGWGGGIVEGGRQEADRWVGRQKEKESEIEESR